MARIQANKVAGTTIKKPNGRNAYHITPVEVMKMPECQKMDSDTDPVTGAPILYPEDTTLVVVIAGRLQKLPCTVAMFQEALSGDYGRRPDLRHFLYQRPTRVNGQRVLEPVSMIASVDLVAVEGGMLPTDNKAYAARFLVDTKDGSVVPTALHFKLSMPGAASMISALASAESLKVGDAVGGSKDMYVSAINATEDKKAVEVVVRSKDADSEHGKLASAGVLKG